MGDNEIIVSNIRNVNIVCARRGAFVRIIVQYNTSTLSAALSSSASCSQCSQASPPGLKTKALVRGPSQMECRLFIMKKLMKHVIQKAGFSNSFWRRCAKSCRQTGFDTPLERVLDNTAAHTVDSSLFAAAFLQCSPNYFHLRDCPSAASFGVKAGTKLVVA
jgi:hypothetical protein